MRVKIHVVFFLLLITIFLCSGCNNTHFSPALFSKKSEQNTELNSEESQVKGILNEVSNVSSINGLKKCVDSNFKSNTISLALDGKSEKEFKLYLSILRNLKFISFDKGVLKYEVYSNKGVIDYLSKDYKGFVKDYNNFKSLNLSESEIKDYVLDYLIQLFQSDSGAQIKTSTKKCTISLGKDGKLSSDTFLTGLLNDEVEDLLSEIQSKTFNQETTEKTAKFTASDFKIGKSKVMLCPVKDKNGKVTSLQKILVTVDTVLQDGNARDKLCAISAMNDSINLDWQKNSLYYVHYTIENLSGIDLVYSDCFRLVDGNKNSYSLPIGSCFGLTTSSILKKGSTTTLDTAIAGPNTAKLGWYDSVNKYFYLLGGENE